MPEWPGGDNPAVYQPPRAPSERREESRGERKALLAAARVREGMTARDEELEEVLARQDRNGGRSDILTEANRQEMRLKYRLTDRVDRLHERGESFRSQVGWEDGRHLMTVYLREDQDDVRRQLEAVGADRLIIKPALESTQDLQPRSDQVFEQADQLEAEGIELLGGSVNRDGSGIEVWYAAPDQLAAERVVTERFGEVVKPIWHGATSEHTFTAFPFGSWDCEENRLTVYYALGHNGERPGGCLAYETDRAVVVSLQILSPRGARTLIGGFKPSHATVELDQPLGARTVIDDSENRARPHWTEVEPPPPGQGPMRHPRRPPAP